jgi:hypothetical protein
MHVNKLRKQTNKYWALNSFPKLKYKKYKKLSMPWKDHHQSSVNKMAYHGGGKNIRGERLKQIY